MSHPFKRRPVNLISHLHKTVTAHQAVHEGIATHAEKEHARRLDAQNLSRANASLLSKGELSSGSL